MAWGGGRCTMPSNSVSAMSMEGRYALNRREGDQAKATIQKGLTKAVVARSPNRDWRLVQWTDDDGTITLSIEVPAGPDLMGEQRWQHVPVEQAGPLKDVVISLINAFIDPIGQGILYNIV